MIVDHLSNASKYYAINPDFEVVFEKLKNCMLLERNNMKYIINDRAEIILQHDVALRKRECLYEYHKSYIDIHLCLENQEIIEYAAICISTVEKNEETDFFIVNGENAGNVILTKGMFAIFFSGELHKPLIGSLSEKTSKCVGKIFCGKSDHQILPRME